MNLDIRLPIGLLFVLLGGLLCAYGVLTHLFEHGLALGQPQPGLYERSLGININFWWGLVLLLFGALMTWLGRRGAPKRPTPKA